MAKSQQNEKKLKPLLQDLPAGYFVDAAWLVARNIDRKSIFNYERQGWLEKVVRGVYRRPSNDVFSTDSAEDWERTVLSLQHLMQWSCHVGGKTALDIAGFEHYVSFQGARSIFLYGSTPKWLKRLPTSELYQIRTNSLFQSETLGLSGRSGDERLNDTSASQPRTLIQSKPERAILEWLNELPDKTTFHSVDMVFEGLATLRPKLLAKLLKDCRSVKVKRLFFVFADRHKHAWRKHIQVDDFDLGAGPRALVKGGKLHPKYRIYVPKEFVLTDTEMDTDGP
ncbi:MAG: type IV toxin-antitoxin system AbiEi family antitoxin domain-containing protein [Sulfitobacter sp.]|jgi:Transcriptional regulator, AbiEi antitoxin, Type IV TA system/Transcriptional regulator, AbiEi antitoxin N-terminal domain|tara:strand:+ start:7984 stop:8829 length:846 start_codon:yes stop_codon:yes gene_type:complete